MSNTLKTTIPFSGFYESLHDSELDQALEMAFSDDSGTPNAGLLARAWDGVNWRYVHEEYAKEYCKAFASEFQIKSLTFEETHSPREYNFTTDRIFAFISLEDVRSILAKVDPVKLAEKVRECFTSRDGFSSFYSADVDDWGDVETWDHNQTGTLMQTFADQETRNHEAFDQWAEFELMEDARGNGHMDNWIFGSNPEKLNRLDRIGRYLRDRSER
jgi:hypothetical protein